MSKQKVQTTTQSDPTGLNKLPRLRKLKVTLATAESRAYKTGFVFGGRRLGHLPKADECLRWAHSSL